MRWGDALRDIRRRRLLRQSELAELIDVTQGTISRWESDDQIPDIRYQARIRELFLDDYASRDERLMLCVRSSLFPRVLVNANHDILAASRPYLLLTELTDAMASVRYPIERAWKPTSPGARKALKRAGHSLWIGTCARVSFVSSFETASHESLLVKEVWNSFMMTTGDVVLHCEVAQIRTLSDAEPWDEDDPPVEIEMFEDLVC